MKPAIRLDRLIPGAALFLSAFANIAFFRNLLATFADQAGGYLHVASLALLLFLVLVLVLSLLCGRRTAKPVLTVLFVLSAFAAYFMDTYNVVIDRDMVVNAISTDLAESRDLFTPRMAIYLLLLGVLPSALLLRSNIVPETLRHSVLARARLAAMALVGITALLVASGSFYASFFREHKVLRYYTNPLTPIHAAVQVARTRVAGDGSAPEPIGEDAHIPTQDVERELVIMVVGETARADHLGLNGYARDTTPLLEKEDVVSFSRVSSCGTSTAVSVPCMFAVYDRADFSGERATATENALDVLRRSGVNILWRDNNSSSKGVALRVPTEDFRSAQLNPVCDTECRDEGMLAGLQEYIAQHPSGDILIVLHQMGSHGPAYYKRYPQAFKVFAPTCETNELDTCSQEQIVNTYDNTILYTDHFLAKVIGFLRSYDDRFETAMLYASDHGESLGESGLYLHGLPYFVAPDSQTHVPVIMWFGGNYHDADVPRLRRLSDRELSHDNVFHTLLGLFEVTSDVYNAGMDMLQQAKTEQYADSVTPSVGGE